MGYPKSAHNEIMGDKGGLRDRLEILSMVDKRGKASTRKQRDEMARDWIQKATRGIRVRKKRAKKRKFGGTETENKGKQPAKDIEGRKRRNRRKKSAKSGEFVSAKASPTPNSEIMPSLGLEI